jgi:hypothetical protein
MSFVFIEVSSDWKSAGRIFPRFGKGGGGLRNSFENAAGKNPAVVRRIPVVESIRGEKLQRLEVRELSQVCECEWGWGAAEKYFRDARGRWFSLLKAGLVTLIGNDASQCCVVLL